MSKALRLAAWGVLALVLLYVAFQVVSIIFGVVTWIVSTLITLGIVAVLLYLAYLGYKMLSGGGSGGHSQPRSRSRTRSQSKSSSTSSDREKERLFD